MDIENFEENNIFFVLVLCLSVYRGMYKRNKEKREREWGGFVMYRIFPMIWRLVSFQFCAGRTITLAERCFYLAQRFFFFILTLGILQFDT